MEQVGPSRRGGSGAPGIYDAVRFFTVVGTLFLLAALAVFLVFRASQGGFYPGVRSLASVLLPLIVGSFLFLFNRGLLERVRSAPTALAFGAAMIAGAGIMLTLQFLTTLSAVPIAEFLVSACFSLLVFSSGSIYGLAFAPEERDKALSYYYGVVAGMLLYIILLGFPVMSVGEVV